jgi:hypothetical protein
MVSSHAWPGDATDVFRMNTRPFLIGYYTRTNQEMIASIKARENYQFDLSNYEHLSDWSALESSFTVIQYGLYMYIIINCTFLVSYQRFYFVYRPLHWY